MYYTLVKVETKEENVELSQTFSRSIESTRSVYFIELLVPEF